MCGAAVCAVFAVYAIQANPVDNSGIQIVNSVNELVPENNGYKFSWVFQELVKNRVLCWLLFKQPRPNPSKSLSVNCGSLSVKQIK